MKDKSHIALDKESVFEEQHVLADRYATAESREAGVTCQEELPIFLPAEVASIPLLLRFFRTYPSRACDYSIGGVLIWTSLLKYKYAIVEDSLILMGEDPQNGELLFYEPRGPISRARYESIFREYCCRIGRQGTILYPEEKEFNTREDGEISAEGEIVSGIHCDREEYAMEWREYLYEVERFATFAGKKMEKKRNHLHYFENNFSGFEVEPIGENNLGDLITFTLAFALSHSDSELAEYESREVTEVLRQFDLYPFDGIAIRLEGKIIGYTFGEKIGDTFHVHAEKGDVAYRGIYQMLSSQMARRVMELYPDTVYLNREDDMGIESLRQSKLSYHPALLINKRKVKSK